MLLAIFILIVTTLVMINYQIASYNSMVARLPQEQCSPNKINHIQIEKIGLDLDVAEDKNETNYYLNHTLDNKSSISGSLFYYSSYPNIIYGHNMLNGTMFGRLNAVSIGDNVKITTNKSYNYVVNDIYYTDASYFPKNSLYTKDGIYLSTCNGDGRIVISLEKE